MQKIYLNLKFPLLALAIISLIYGGLLVSDLKTKTESLQKQNQTILFKTATLSDKIDQVQNDTNTTKNNNDILAAKLATAQKQIYVLQNNASIKKVLGASTANNIELKPAIITKTITNTVTQEVEKNQATVTIENVGSYKVDLQAGDNAFDILKRAATNNFALEYDTYSFGVFVTSIGGITPQGNQYWAFYFNGAFSNVGASDQPIQKGDSVFWQLASF